MRRARLILAVLVLCGSGPGFAQEEWTEYINRMDRFTTVFPGQPTVQETTWPSEYGMVFPGRVYAVQQGPSRYSVTVIDYTDAEKRYSERPGAGVLGVVANVVSTATRGKPFVSKTDV